MDASETAGIKLNTIPADLDITVPGIAAFTYSNPVDTTAIEWITYTSIDGTNVLQGVTRGAEGWAAKTHLNGCTIGFVFSKSHVNEIMKVLTGTTTGAKLDSPKIVTAIMDSNGNEIIKTPATASAVNELTATNAATGNSPELSATGGDTNIGVKITPKGTGAIVIPATTNIKPGGNAPKRGIYIAASSLIPATTAGCASVAQSESSTNKVNYSTLDFDATTAEKAWLMAFQTPDYWDLSTITVRFHWTAASGSGDVIWGVDAVALSNDDAIDTAPGTAQTVTDSLITALDVHVSADTSALTVGGTPAKGDLLFLRVYRDAAAGGDTLAVDAKLIGITIKFGVGQFDDQ